MCHSAGMQCLTYSAWLFTRLCLRMQAATKDGQVRSLQSFRSVCPLQHCMLQLTGCCGCRTDMHRERVKTKHDMKGSKAAERPVSRCQHPPHSRMDLHHRPPLPAITTFPPTGVARTNRRIAPNPNIAQQFINQPFCTAMPCHRVHGAGTRGEGGAHHPPRRSRGVRQSL